MTFEPFQLDDVNRQQLYFYQSTKSNPQHEFNNMPQMRIEALQNQHHIWLEINGVVQSACEKQPPFRPVMAHTLVMFLPQIHDAVPTSILELGGGALTAQRYFSKTQPHIKFITVEYSQKVIDAVAQVFPESWALNVVCDNAFNYLKTAKSNKLTFDWLMVDLFNGAESPPEVFSREFFESATTLINVSGWLIFNCLENDHSVLSILLGNIKMAFGKAPKVFAVPGMKNHIIMVKKSEAFNFPDDIENHNIAGNFI